MGNHNPDYKKIWKLGKKELDTDFYDINKEGELVVNEGNYQYNLPDIIKKFGTPLEIVFPFVIEQRLNFLIDSFSRHIKNFHYKGKFFYHYPMKVNQNKEYVLPVISEDGNLEVSSANELWLVKKLWEQDRFNDRIKIICNGPKTNQYLGLITDLKTRGLKVIPVIEDTDELEYFNSHKWRVNADVGVRIDIDVKVQSHWDKKVNRFGMSTDEIKKIGHIKNLKLLHYHIGSQVENPDDLVKLLREAMKVFVFLKKLNPGLNAIDMGGGFPVTYEKNKSYSIDRTVRGIVEVLATFQSKYQVSPDIIVEWGRHLVAPAQISVFKVIHQKDIEKAVARKWYVLDGSFMNDLCDTWAVQQKWQVVPVNNLTSQSLARVWLAGSSCDSDDKYTGNGYLSLPVISPAADKEMPEQYLGILDTGAYQDALSSHHCLLSSPAKIIAQNGILTVARRRETSEDVGRQFGW